MTNFLCPGLSYKNENDQGNFIRGYVESKTKELERIFEKNNGKTGSTACGETHHPAIDLEEIMRSVFERLEKPDKKNMVEAYRGWAKWFLVGTETFKVLADYKNQLVYENTDGFRTITRGYTLIERYCICRSYRTEREKRKYHRKLERARAKRESYVIQSGNDSGSEGYYDSDC